MNQLLSASLAFPTVILTIVVGIALVYWVFVILGALDIDLVADGDVDGALDGAGDIGDVGHIGDVGDVGHIGDVGDVGDVGHGDAGGDHGGGNHGGHGGSAGILAALGLRKVPMTITVSLISLFAWIICLVVMVWLGDWDGLPRWVLNALVFVASLILALPLAAICARPIAPLFVIEGAKKRTDFVGSVCTVTTGEVTSRFGQARIKEPGHVLDVQVRCDIEHRFSRHDRALIIDYDTQRSAYLIEPMDEVLGKRAT